MLNYSEIEDDISDKVVLPYVYYDQETMGGKLLLAKYVMQARPEVLLLPSYFLFSYSAVAAGLTEKQLEYIASNAPAEYKKELSKTFSNENKIKEVIEIGRMLDDDYGQNTEKNQERIRRVYQYIRDNSIAFQFD